jgi:hypothetical protein
MTWQAMFVAGACTVSVHDGGGVVLWSGALVAGDFSIVFTDSAGNHYQVEVGVDGTVQLLSQGAIYSTGITCNVYPQYDTSANQTQLANLDALTTAGSGAASCDVGAPVALTATGGVIAPPSVTFAAHAPATGGAFVGVSRT